MYDNFDSNNRPFISPEKLLLKTVRNIETAIALIDDNYDEISELTMIETLARNSDLLLNYLQDNILEEDVVNKNQFSRQNRQKKSTQPKIEPVEEIKTNFSSRQNFNFDNLKQQKSKKKLNLVILISLIISLSLNIYTFFFDLSSISNIDVNDNQKEELLINSKDNESENHTEISNLNQNNIELNQDQDIDNIENSNITNEENIPIVEEKNIEANTLDNDIEVINITKTPEQINIYDGKNTIDSRQSDLSLSVENQLREITDTYQVNLIDRIKPNYNRNSIIIIVNDDWQKIEINRKQELIQKIFNKVKSIDFYRFQIQDIHNNLLARNAAIGDNLIIFDN